MDPKDEEKATFIINGGTYCYVRMPFGLKTYERGTKKWWIMRSKTKIGRNFEVYIYDIIIKSKEEQDLV